MRKIYYEHVSSKELINIDENDDDDKDNDDKDNYDSGIANPDRPSAMQTLQLLDEVMLFVDDHEEMEPSVQNLISPVEKIKVENSKQSDIRNFVGYILLTF